MPDKTKIHANQLDVARKAGVSVSTVSRALSNAPGISEALRDQIRLIADDLGYQPRGTRPNDVGPLRIYVASTVAIGGLAPFYEAILDGLTSAAKAALLAVETRLIDAASVKTQRSDAEEGGIAFFVGMDVSHELIARLAPDSIVVLVNGYDPTMRHDCVAPNNFYGGAMAARLLLDAGHRSLLFVKDQIRWTTRQRHRGFLSEIDERGDARASLFSMQDGDAAMIEAVRQRRSGASDWTGAFCVNDMMAIRLIQALETAGYRVPEEISVIGFDDLPFAAMTNPRLTTLRVDCAEIGRQAVALLLRRLATPHASVLQIECGVQPVPGDTVARLADHRG